MDIKSYDYPNYGIYKRGIREWLLELDLECFLTFNFNWDTNLAAGRRLLYQWHQGLDRKLHGKYYWKKDPRDRTFFIAFPEVGGKEGKLHYHAPAQVPKNRRQDFMYWAPKYWENLVPSGDLYITFSQDELREKKNILYSSKDIWREENYENFIISTEFSK